MKITIESTTKLIELQTPSGTVPARVWEGTTERGAPVFCFVTRIALAIPADQVSEDTAAEFNRDLIEQRAPSPAVRAFDMRYVL